MKIYVYINYVIANSDRCFASFAVFWGNGVGIFVHDEQKIDIRL